MTIILPGYETVYEGRVYFRDFTLKPGDGDIDLREILMLSKYTAPTEDQVVEYLKGLADKVSTRASLLVGINGDLPNDLSDLEKVLMRLPAQIISDMRTGNDVCMKFIRENTSALNTDVPLTYLHVGSGVILPNFVTENKDRIAGPEWYDEVLKNKQLKSVGLGQRYKITIRLFDRKLPDRKEFDILLKHEVSDSRTLKVNGSCVTEDVEIVCSALYEGLKIQDNVMALYDNSEVALKEAALIPVVRLYENLKLKMALDPAMSDGRSGPNGLRH